MLDNFCPQCGAPIEEGAMKCRYCETPFVNKDVVSPQQFNFQEVQYQNEVSDRSDVEANKVFGIIAYLGIFVFISIFAAPKSSFARFHSNQGLVLFIANVLLSLLSEAMRFIWMGGMVVSLGRIFCLILMIVGLISAAQGQTRELPIIGKIKLLK